MALQGLGFGTGCGWIAARCHTANQCQRAIGMSGAGGDILDGPAQSGAAGGAAPPGRTKYAVECANVRAPMVASANDDLFHDQSPI